MRLVGLLLLILVGLLWLASEAPLAAPQPSAETPTGWRRTAEGWELASLWPLHRAPREPALHPAVVGLLQLLLAATALVAFSGDRPQ